MTESTAESKTKFDSNTWEIPGDLAIAIAKFYYTPMVLKELMGLNITLINMAADTASQFLVHKANNEPEQFKEIVSDAMQALSLAPNELVSKGMDFEEAIAILDNDQFISSVNGKSFSPDDLQEMLKKPKPDDLSDEAWEFMQVLGVKLASH